MAKEFRIGDTFPKVEAPIHKGCIFKYDFAKTTKNPKTIQGINNSMVKKILAITNTSDKFYCIVAGGYALSTFIGIEDKYGGDIDLWVIRRTNTRNYSNEYAEVDAYVNEIIQAIINMGGVDNSGFNNSNSNSRTVEPKITKKNKHISVQYTTTSMTRSLRSVNFTLVKEHIYKSEKYISKQTKDFQIILGVFDSPEEVISKFDVDVCKVAYVLGNEPYYLVLNESCIVNKFNTLKLSVFSKTYLQRLSKYMKYGYSVVMPELMPDKLCPEMKFLDGNVRIMSDVHDNIAYVTQIIYNTQKLTTGYESQPKTRLELLYLDRITPLVTITDINNTMRAMKYQEILKTVKSVFPYIHGAMYMRKYQKMYTAIPDSRLFAEIKDKYEKIKNNKVAYEYATKKSELLYKIQARYISFHLQEFVDTFNNATNSCEKRWNADQLFNFTPLTKQEWYGEA